MYSTLREGIIGWHPIAFALLVTMNEWRGHCELKPVIPPTNESISDRASQTAPILWGAY